jgi:hypothetical protein
MKTLRVWISPALFAVLWISLTAFALAVMTGPESALRPAAPSARQARHSVHLSYARK